MCYVNYVWMNFFMNHLDADNFKLKRIKKYNPNCFHEVHEELINK